MFNYVHILVRRIQLIIRRGPIGHFFVVNALSFEDNAVFVSNQGIKTLLLDQRHSFGWNNWHILPYVQNVILRKSCNELSK